MEATNADLVSAADLPFLMLFNQTPKQTRSLKAVTMSPYTKPMMIPRGELLEVLIKLAWNSAETSKERVKSTPTAVSRTSVYGTGTGTHGEHRAHLQCGSLHL